MVQPALDNCGVYQNHPVLKYYEHHLQRSDQNKSFVDGNI